MTGPQIANLVADLIARLGFPVVVTLILLWERRTTLRDITTALVELRKAIEILTIASDTAATYRVTESGRDIIRVQE